MIRAAASAAALLIGACSEVEPDACAVAGRSPAADRWCVVRETRFLLGAGNAAAGDLLVRPDTLLYVLLPDQKQVRVFDARDRQIRSFGGTASADTFGRPTALGWAEPLLWIYDADGSRVFFFDPRGMRNSIVPMPLLSVPGDSTTFVAALNHDNWLVLIEPAGRDTAPHRALLVRQTSGLVVADTLLALQHPARSLVPRAAAAPTKQTGRLLQPLAARSFVAASSVDGMIVTVEPSLLENSTPVFVLTKTNQVGDTVFSRQIPYQPVPLTAKHVQAAVKRVQEQARFSGHGQIGAREIEQGLYKPAHLPTVTALVIATDGTILLRREDDGGPTVEWSIFKATGDPIATQTTPSATDFRAAAGPYFFGFERDNRGALMAARYRALQTDTTRTVSH
jgi:hypothetical protein